MILWKARAEGPDRRLRARPSSPDGGRARRLRRARHPHRRRTPAASTRPGSRPSCAQLRDKLGIHARIAHVEGDDLLPRLAELRRTAWSCGTSTTGIPLAALGRHVVTANAYLGAWGIVEALERGADVVICPRVTDASLVVGPAAWHFGWARDDWDRLAGAVVAGHVIECGPQARAATTPSSARCRTSSSSAFRSPRCTPTAAFVVTKHPGTGGWSRSARSPRSCSTRSQGPPTRTPTCVGALRHDPPGSRRPRPRARLGRPRRARPRRRPRSASTTSAATATR